MKAVLFILLAYFAIGGLISWVTGYTGIAGALITAFWPVAIAAIVGGFIGSLILGVLMTVFLIGLILELAA
jgi:hypothetical protein